MERLLRYGWILAMLLIVSALPFATSIGQSEGQAGDALIIQSRQDSSKSFVLEKNYRLKILTTDGKKHNGELQGVSESSLTLGTEELSFSKITKIRIQKGEGSRIGGLAAVLTGFLTALFGAILGLLGRLVINSQDATAEGCANAVLGVLMIVIGIAMGGLGIVMLIVGLIAYIVGKAIGRAFKIGDKWKLKRLMRK